MNLVILLRAKALIWKNNLLRMKPRQRFGLLAFLIFILYISAAILRGGVQLFTVLGEMDPGAAQGVLASLFSGLIVFSFFWGAGITLSQLYLSSDLESLVGRAAPSVEHLCALAAERGMQNLVFPALISLVFFLAYGVAFNSSVGYYLLALLGFVCLLFLPQVAAMALIMLAVSLIPARRAQEIYALLWTLVGGDDLGRLDAHLEPAGIAQPGGALAPRPARHRASRALSRPLSCRVAGTDAERLAGRRRTGRGPEPGAATGGQDCGMVALGYALFQRAFYTGWSRMQEVVPRRQRTAGKVVSLCARSCAGCRSKRAPSSSRIGARCRAICVELSGLFPAHDGCRVCVHDRYRGRASARVRGLRCGCRWQSCRWSPSS